MTPVTLWLHGEAGHNHEANTELKALLGGGAFDNPKPTRLIRRLLELSTGPDSIVLDFFAG
ncbi:MAG TPA: DNA methyltransferase [Armatimonadota bacterium]|nr:DNA methyltransferase [Armatimonadota bacterium]